MNAVHPYTRDEHDAGFALAKLFLARIASGEPIEADGLAQQLSIARMASLERLRAFAAAIQAALFEGARDAS